MDFHKMISLALLPLWFGSLLASDRQTDRRRDQFLGALYFYQNLFEVWLHVLSVYASIYFIYVQLEWVCNVNAINNFLF